MVGVGSAAPAGPVIFADNIHDSSLIAGSIVAVQVHVANTALPADVNGWQVIGHVSPRNFQLLDVTPGTFLDTACATMGGILLFHKVLDFITGSFAADQVCLAGPPQPIDMGATGGGVLMTITVKVKGELVIAGATPAEHQVLSSDPHVKIRDINFGPFAGNGVWDPTESMYYDSNLNGKVDKLLVAPFSELLVLRRTIDSSPKGKPLTFDPKVTYVDSNADGVFDCPTTGTDFGGNPYRCASYSEAIVYDAPNTNGLYDVRLGDSVVSLDSANTFLRDIDGFTSAPIPAGVQDGSINNSLHLCDFSGQAATLSPRTLSLGANVTLHANISCDSTFNSARVQFDIATPSGPHNIVLSPAVQGNATSGVNVAATYTPLEPGFYTVTGTVLWSEDGGILFTYSAVAFGSNSPQTRNFDFTVR